MSQYVSSPTRADTAAGAIAQHLRVKTPGALVVAGATDIALGTAFNPITAAGPATVLLRTAQGTRKMVANGAITAGNTVYAAASGKVAASGTIVEGQALESATANNDVIEVLPFADAAAPFGTQTVIADDAEVAGLNVILPGITGVYVDGVTNNADDFVVLPALADVPNGFTITMVGQAGSNFEVRTPASSNEEINSEDCDGTKEYLFTNTQIHEFVKIDNTIGWMGHGYSAIGAVVTAVVPD
jgi:hypothetical protein